MSLAAWPLFPLALLLPVMLAFYWLGRRRRRKKLRLLLAPGQVGIHLGPYIGRLSRTKAAMVVVALAALIFATLQPQWGQLPEDAPRYGRDIVFLLDVSLSMLAEDTPSNRLEEAKKAISNMVEAIGADGGHRLGLVIFAGRAGLQCPLTLDYRFFLKRLAEADPQSSSVSGSALDHAVDRALSGFGPLQSEFTDFILLSDGEDHTGRPVDAVRRAAQQGITVHTVGFGDADAAHPIPDPDTEPGAEQRFLLSGEDKILTRMRQDTLRDMATAGDGVFIAAGTGSADLGDLYAENIEDKPTREIRAAKSNRLAHRYAWFVWPAFILLLLEPMLRFRRRVQS